MRATNESLLETAGRTVNALGEIGTDRAGEMSSELLAKVKMLVDATAKLRAAAATRRDLRAESRRTGTLSGVVEAAILLVTKTEPELGRKMPSRQALENASPLAFAEETLASLHGKGTLAKKMSDIIEAALKQEEACRECLGKAVGAFTMAQDTARAARIQLQTAVKQAELVVHLSTPAGSPARRMLHKGGRRKGVAPTPQLPDPVVAPVVPATPTPAPAAPESPAAPLKVVQVA